jgi:hypothetical protein
LKILLKVLLFSFLTILTQVGGIIYLFSLTTHKFINRFTNKKTYRFFFRSISFLSIYSLATFFVVPIIAKPFGRVPLPLLENNNIKPLNIFTCFLNRNYVKPELRESLTNVAKKMNDKYPKTVVNYLDASFPFFDGFSILPHLSHNDGKKLDISFCYLESKTKAATNKCPSFIGYGVAEEPLINEKCTSCFCADKGYWQYSLLRKITPQYNKNDFIFDDERTKELINFFVHENSILKIFIEPHLKLRLNLSSEKVRFHGCQAIRHDDHIHIQM